MVLSKRGVSPLIATVLLVMIVVSIGAAVMVVIQGLAQEGIDSTQAQQQLIKCGTDVEVGLLAVGDTYRMCIDTRNTSDIAVFKIFLENKGLKDIADWKFRIIGDGAINDTNGGFTALPRGSLLGYRFEFGGNVGPSLTQISKISLSPKIPGGPSNPSVICTEPNLEWDDTEIEEMQNCSSSSVTWDDNI
jgi:flagellin-like protein